MTTHDELPQYGHASFIEPAPFGYLYLGMRIASPRRLPFVRRNERRRTEIEKCRASIRGLEALPEVVAATVYEAVLIPPVEGSPRFDVLVLVETTSPETIATVEASQACRGLDTDFVMRARNLRRIGDVDDPRSGTFLFNHFTAQDPELALRTFENISGWFTDRGGVKDSALLGPTGDSTYVFVNHVRLPTTPVRFMLRLATPSFRTYVAANLKANDMRNAR